MTVEPDQEIQVPEEHDIAIYVQGYMQGQTAGDETVENAYAPDTPQAASWQAGFDAGKAAATPATPEPAPEETSRRRHRSSDE